MNETADPRLFTCKFSSLLTARLFGDVKLGAPKCKAVGVPGVPGALCVGVGKEGFRPCGHGGLG